MTKLLVNEFFGPTIQGEGKYTGTPSFFIRLNGCNLCCRWKNSDGSYTICDTAYTSHHPEPPKYKTVEELFDSGLDRQLKMYSNGVHHIVITGGEPLIQKNGLEELLSEIARRYGRNHYTITIETNGTIEPSDDMFRLVDLWSVSPKLCSSASFEGSDIPVSRQKQHEQLRINFLALNKIITSGFDYQMKFVWTGPECENEILSLSIDPTKVCLMPEGITPEEIQASAESGALDACYRNGWRFCDREHIRLFGNKRGV